MNTRTKTALALLALTALLTSGCSSAIGIRPFADPSVSDLSTEGIAVLPFDNLTEDRGAGKSLENMVLIEMLRESQARFSNPGDVSQALQELRVRLATSISRTDLQDLGARLSVGLVVQGIVQEYSMERLNSAAGGGEVPIVSLTIRILDVRNGDIVWATTATRRGNDSEKIFGIGRVDSLELLAQRVASEIASAFARSVPSVDRNSEALR